MTKATQLQQRTTVTRTNIRRNCIDCIAWIERIDQSDSVNWSDWIDDVAWNASVEKNDRSRREKKMASVTPRPEAGR